MIFTVLSGIVCNSTGVQLYGTVCIRTVVHLSVAVLTDCRSGVYLMCPCTFLYLFPALCD